MPRNPSTHPTEVELQILRVLWQGGPSTVRAIHNELSRSRAVLYATTVKMLVVMLEKGLVRRDDSVRPQVYAAAVSQRQTQGKMLRHLIRKVYDGSATSLVLQVLSTQKPTAAELRQIRRMLDEMEGGQS